MAGYEENPYASPKGAAEPAAPEIRGVWRDGDELVALPRDMKAPKACWVTNETRFVFRSKMNRMSWAQVVALGLLFLPGVGLLLSPVALLVLLLSGHVRWRQPIGWLAWHVRFRLLVGLLVNVVLVWINFALLMFGSYAGNLWVILFLGPSVIMMLLSMKYCDQLLTGLDARFGDNGTFRFRGVHPAYLAGLPALPEGATVENARDT